MVNLVTMPVSRGAMENYQNKHVRQVEHTAKQWEARAHKVANDNNQRKWLERQNNANYRNECDRIRQDLSPYKILFLTPRQTPEEKKQLEFLFLQVMHKKYVDA